MPLQCSELQTREETKERASLFDMEFSQPQCRDRVRGLLLWLGRIKGFNFRSTRSATQRGRIGNYLQEDRLSFEGGAYRPRLHRKCQAG
jgi:hypothetical protein